MMIRKKVILKSKNLNQSNKTIIKSQKRMKIKMLRKRNLLKRLFKRRNQLNKIRNKIQNKMILLKCKTQDI